MTVAKVPLRPVVPQKLRVTLGSIEYALQVRWNAFMGAWVLDIHDSQDNPVLNGVPLITGTDLLSQFTYLQIGGGTVKLIVLTQAVGHAPDEVPNSQNLGLDGNLYVVT